VTQIFVSPLECAVQLRLVSGQRHVFAQLPQEFAVAAAETVHLPARRDEHSEYRAFGEQRRSDQRMQSAGGEALR
jgi:hypothetical protein